MTLWDFVITVVAIIFGSIGQLMIKMGLTSFCAKYGNLSVANIWGRILPLAVTPHIIAAIISFVISAAFWMVVMSKRDLSQIYPFIALSYIFIAILAHAFLNETIGGWRIAGILIIVAGVLVLAQDKASAVCR
jgi:drug/metabolite transporter (DMT)-like permease